ncbi:MAG TPA: esterase-like activity of phytase family protein [Bryobacteraceae bacterium]|nr:esterase-like activity of phytase family protein [Bryobacteraceae bacterium]
MTFVRRNSSLVLLAAGMIAAQSNAQITVLAIGNLTQTSAGSNVDLSGLTYKLENQAPANLLGGLGSGLTYVSADTYLALPDRGPNAMPFDSAIDDTDSYINRFHTIRMGLSRNTTGKGLPFNLVSMMQSTTLLWSPDKLVYGTGAGLGVGSGAPAVNTSLQHFFTGRSDNFDPTKNSGAPLDARFDSESIRVSNDGQTVYISDEYGPYIYGFDRSTGRRTRFFKMPDNFYVPLCSPIGANEIANNTVGRTANKGMEGLAITPDGKTLVGIMQNALLQDANELDSKGKKPAANLLRIVTVDIASATVTHQYGYLLTTGSGVSDILALNNHEFLVDERDGRGREGGNNLTSNDARVKQPFKIDLNGATDISAMDGITAVQNVVAKTLFLDIVQALVGVGLDPTKDIPAKIEGITFGPTLKTTDKTGNTVPLYTLWVANDNDFVLATNDVPPIPNPNQFFVFGFTDADLGGSTFVPQFK